jgi:hypothetical protein
MKKVLIIVALLCSFSAFGPRIRYDGRTTTAPSNVAPGNAAPLMTMPFASVTVCGLSAVGSPCTNTVPVFSDLALTQPVSQPMKTNAKGRFGFWVAPGNYIYSVISSQGLFVETLPLTLTSSPVYLEQTETWARGCDCGCRHCDGSPCWRHTYGTPAG